MFLMLAVASDCFRLVYRRVRCHSATPKAGVIPASDTTGLISSQDLQELKEGNGSPEVKGDVTLSRRRLLALGVIMAGATLGGCAVREARDIEITRIKIPLRRLPLRLNGFSVVQITDVHYGMLCENGRLIDIVNRVNDLVPDLIVITGDLVDEAVSHMEKMESPLANLKSRLGVLAVTGNHEFYSGVDRVDGVMRRAGIQVLRNEIKVLPGELQILGIDDPISHRRVDLPKPDFAGLLKRLDPEKPSIFLYHRPIRFDEVAASGVGLQLSGHTHGPQFFPMIPITMFLYPRYRGLYQEKESFLYVSRGVGTGGPPMRLGSRPELVHFQLCSRNSET